MEGRATRDSLVHENRRHVVRQKSIDFVGAKDSAHGNDVETRAYVGNLLDVYWCRSFGPELAEEDSCLLAHFMIFVPNWFRILLSALRRVACHNRFSGYIRPFPLYGSRPCGLAYDHPEQPSL